MCKPPFASSKPKFLPPPPKFLPPRDFGQPFQDPLVLGFSSEWPSLRSWV